MRVRRAVAVALALALGGLTACGHEAPPPWSRLVWARRLPPVPHGDRAIVRDAAWCGDRWWVVGATADRRGATRPAAWTSPDGDRWAVVRLDPRGDFYASAAILSAVACHAGRVAVLGAKSGGAHGNPRVATWRERADGSLVAVSAPFELYGGPNAVSVHRIAGGMGGFLVEGVRASGAAVWTSPDGRRFVLHERSPGLASTSATGTQALDATWWDDAWLVVGDSTQGGVHLVATTWTGTGNGPWTPTHLPGGERVSTAERVAVTGDGPLAAGALDDRFALWDDRDRWSLASTFGEQDPDAGEPSFVSGLAWTGHLVAATYSDGAGFRLAVGPPDHLTDGVPLPARVRSTGDHTVTVAAHGDDLLLLTDDGTSGRLWLTRAPSG